MRGARSLVGLSLLLFAAGCIDSTQPFYTPETLKKDLDLAGAWKEVDPAKHAQEIDVFTVKSLGDGEFEVRRKAKSAAGAADPGEEAGPSVLHAVELGGKLYFDATSPFSADGHIITRALLDGDRLFVAGLDFNKTRKYAAKDKLPYRESWSSLVLDAPTADLQKFIASHWREIFDYQAHHEFVRIKKPDAGD